jgi:nicotinic acid phosphoribosyltransferase
MSAPLVVINMGGVEVTDLLNTLTAQVHTMSDKVTELVAIVTETKALATAQAEQLTALQVTVDAYQEANAAADAKLAEAILTLKASGVDTALLEQLRLDLLAVNATMADNTAAVVAIATDVSETPIPDVDGLLAAEG